MKKKEQMSIWQETRVWFGTLCLVVGTFLGFNLKWMLECVFGT